MVAARFTERQGFSAPVRLRLLEGDVDEVDARVKTINDKFDTIIRLLIGTMASTTAGAIFLGIQVATG